MDFGFSNNATDNADKSDVVKTNADGSPITDITTGKVDNSVNGIAVDDIDSLTDENGKVVKKTTTTDPFDNGDDTKITNDKVDNKSSDKNADGSDKTTTSDLVAGSVIEIGDDKYTVDGKGDVLDKDGNIFKEAKDVKDWLASFDTIDNNDNTVLSITSIQDAVGIEIVGEDDKPVEFENTPAGIKAYIDAVKEVEHDDIREETINTLYQKYPIIPDVLNYYIANGNSLEGFGEVQDRSGITIDDSNEAQQESIVRAAWTEQNRTGDVESYIAYLKSSGTLLPVSKTELEGLQKLDTDYKASIAEEATKAENERIAKLEEYWSGVKEVITNKNIAGYEIPDTIIINKDGKKTSATPNDFYNYVYHVDKDGKSAYEKERSKEPITNRRDDELLRAYLKFVGGNYSNLVGMAVNKDKVATLKLQAKTRTASSIKVTNPNNNTAKGTNTDFGYN